jgi:hypothetical protein
MGDLGGIAGADGICQSTADGASLGGSWKAFLSVAGESAVDHVSLAGPLENMQGEVIAADESDLFDGSIAAVASYDENGTAIADDIWTGTSFDASPDLTCVDWTSTDGNAKGTRGTAGDVNDDWVSAGFRFCNWSLHLYCVSD